MYCHHIFFVATKRWKPFFQEKLKTLGFTCACATCTAAGLDAMGLGVFLTCVFLSVRKCSDLYWRLDYAAQPVDMI